MAHSTDIVAYVFKADLHHPECALERLVGVQLSTHPAFDVPLEEAFDVLAGRLGIDREDEATFDSGDFPKVVFRDQLEGVEHCGACTLVIK